MPCHVLSHAVERPSGTVEDGFLVVFVLDGLRRLRQPGPLVATELASTRETLEEVLKKELPPARWSRRGSVAQIRCQCTAPATPRGTRVADRNEGRGKHPLAAMQGRPVHGGGQRSERPHRPELRACRCGTGPQLAAWHAEQAPAVPCGEERRRISLGAGPRPFRHRSRSSPGEAEWKAHRGTLVVVGDPGSPTIQLNKWLAMTELAC